MDMDFVDNALGVPSEHSEYRNRVLRLLFLLCGIAWREHAICSGCKTRFRLADFLPFLPVVDAYHYRLRLVRAFQKKGRHCKTATLRGAELRIHQRTAYRFYNVWQYGQTQNHDDNRYDVITRSYVPSKSL